MARITDINRTIKVSGRNPTKYSVENRASIATKYNILHPAVIAFPRNSIAIIKKRLRKMKHR